MSTSIHEAAAQGFSTTNNTAYETGRPSYCTAGLDKIIENSILRTSFTSETFRIIDLGAGTGIFTRDLAIRIQILKQNGTIPSNTPIEIIAAEPVEGMRIRFMEHPLVNSLNLSIIDGSAACLPFSNDSIDLIIAAQAFHWFANIHALQEIHRVLKPQATFVMIWNDKQHDNELVQALESIVGPYYDDSVPRYVTGKWKECFNELPSKYFTALDGTILPESNIQTGDVQMVLNRVLSASVIAASPAAEQESIKQRILNILSTLESTKNSTTYSIPYSTDIYWVRKL